jgi:arylsulfatase
MLKELDTIFSPTMTFDTLRAYNLLTDPGEREGILFPYAWVPGEALPQLTEHVVSLKDFPPIRLGPQVPYEPPNCRS